MRLATRGESGSGSCERIRYLLGEGHPRQQAHEQALAATSTPQRHAMHAECGAREQVIFYD